MRGDLYWFEFRTMQKKKKLDEAPSRYSVAPSRSQREREITTFAGHGLAPVPSPVAGLCHYAPSEALVRVALRMGESVQSSRLPVRRVPRQHILRNTTTIDEYRTRRRKIHIANLSPTFQRI